ncbi:unnamed protein product [Echinostoma caproni]|uniref:EOG090X02D0 n=1 Tax=Echinostoma caproni TaxID=27848 RepID=A0A183AL72_9TREM|nr:unnamed protein product [Echinostoma caproni]
MWDEQETSSFQCQDDRNINGLIGPFLLNANESTGKRGTKRPPQEKISRRIQNEQRVEKIEGALLKHPLILFPYIQASVPPKLFRPTFKILDKTMNAPKATVYKTTATSPRRTPWMGQQKWSGGGRLGSNATRPDEAITAEFCDWVKALNGSSEDNPEVTTIASLFSSTHDAQPPVSAPITVLQLENLPMELKTKGSPPPHILIEQQQMRPSIGKQRFKQSRITKEIRKKYEKLRYGAWFLPPNEWKVQRAEEPLQPSPILSDSQEAELKKRSVSLYDQMIQMHGYEAFKQFAENQNKRFPRGVQQANNGVEN